MRGAGGERLNGGFREMYGTTVFNYLHAPALKHLAWELAYSDELCHGVTPGNYRVDGKDDYDRGQ
ncbi:hypothetical protein [Devosia sp.]|uniref:hypothetical protein n=1 Tax=Devosia sp. TaxID=1871048 RepID=UPI002FC91CFE